MNKMWLFNEFHTQLYNADINGVLSLQLIYQRSMDWATLTHHEHLPCPENVQGASSTTIQPNVLYCVTVI